MAAQPSEWASSAALNALLKYRPQREGLNDLRRQAQERFQAAVRAGISEGRLESQAATGAIAPTRQIYSNSRADAGRSQSLLASALSQLPAGSPFALAAANEGAAGNERTDQAEARSLSGLQDKAVAATETPAFTRQAAMAALMKELTSIRAKGQSLDAAEGADTQAEIDAQRKEAAKDRLTERGQNITRTNSQESNRTSERNTAAHDKQAERDAEIAHGGKGKDGYFKPEKQTQAAGTVAAIRQLAAEAGNSRAERVQALSEGRPEQTAKNAKGESVKVPGFKAYKPDVLMSAALDWVEYGQVTKGTQARLRHAGWDPTKLSIPLERAPKPHTGPSGLTSPAHMG